MSFYYKPGAAPVFNENNPINYARPITVNVYFKAENPPPGYYESVRPKTQAYQTGHRHKFIPLREPKHVETVPDPGVYDPDHTLSSSLLHRYCVRWYCLGANVRTSRWCRPRKSRLRSIFTIRIKSQQRKLHQVQLITSFLVIYALIFYFIYWFRGWLRY